MPAAEQEERPERRVAQRGEAEGGQAERHVADDVEAVPLQAEPADRGGGAQEHDQRPRCPRGQAARGRQQGQRRGRQQDGREMRLGELGRADQAFPSEWPPVTVSFVTVPSG